MNRARVISGFCAVSFLIGVVATAGCQSVPSVEAFRGLGQTELYEIPYDEAFRKTTRALHLEAVDILEKNAPERYIYGQFGGSWVFWEPRTTVYVFFHDAQGGKIGVEFFAQGPYADRLESSFRRSFRKILAGK